MRRILRIYVELMVSKVSNLIALKLATIMKTSYLMAIPSDVPKKYLKGLNDL
jgi:hypothetical protein